MSEEIELARKNLKDLLERPIESEDKPNYSSNQINWEETLSNWEECKDKMVDVLNSNVVNPEICVRHDGGAIIPKNRLIFIAHSKDSCKGKPQLIHQTIQKIPILRRIEKIIKAKNPENDKFLTLYKFIDDKFDRRYDGNELEALSFDFWIYRLIDNGKEYYLLSESKLSEEYSEVIGMKVSIPDLSGISDTLKLNKIANIFFVREHKPAVKVIAPNKLIEFVKETKERNGWDREGFEEYIFTHPDGNVYDYTPEFNKLRLAQFLSGRFEGYPLHIMKLGPVGTGKTTEAEAIDFKFKEELGILEAGTSRMKVLVPSFKEKPANLGYICNCNRVAIIDELMKMVASAMQNQHIDANNYFGELNMLLEQKKRLVGSGNDNSTIVKATAKVCITSNPLKGKSKLSQHLSVLDNTTLSRMIIWVQDKEETEKIYSKNAIRPSRYRFSIGNEPLPTSTSTAENIVFIPCTVIGKSGMGAKDYVHGNDGLLGLLFDFLTIYDSCQAFLVNYDKEKVKQAFEQSVNLAKEPMKQVWKSRGLHHTILILDGLTKLRCLFTDYDSSFTANEQDYTDLANILNKMVKGWDTDLEFKDWDGGF